MRGVLDCYNGKLYLMGPGGYRIAPSPGSKQYKLEESHAGHLMLPCSRFSQNANAESSTQTFAATKTEDTKATESSTRFSCEGKREAAKL